MENRIVRTKNERVHSRVFSPYINATTYESGDLARSPPLQLTERERWVRNPCFRKCFTFRYTMTEGGEEERLYMVSRGYRCRPHSLAISPIHTYLSWSKPGHGNITSWLFFHPDRGLIPRWCTVPGDGSGRTPSPLHNQS